MEIIHGDDRLGRGHIGRLVHELHGGDARAAVGVHRHLRSGGADRLQALGFLAVCLDDVIALEQGQLLHVQRRAVLMQVVHRDDCLGRGCVLIIEDHAALIRRAVREHSDIHALLPCRHIAAHLAAVRLNDMIAGLQEELLEVQLLAVHMVIHHRHGDLRHRRGGRRFSGFRRGRRHLTVHKGDLARIGDALLVHLHLHALAAGDGIALRGAGGSPHICGLPGPAFGNLAVQHRAVLGDVIHRHLHREGLEFRRFLRHGAGGDIQKHRRSARHAVHVIIELVGCLIAGRGRIHLRQPEEGCAAVAPAVVQIEGIGGVVAQCLHRQRLIERRCVHIGPVRPFCALGNIRRGIAPRLPVLICPQNVQHEGIPDVRRKGGSQAAGQHQRRRQQPGCQTVPMHCAIDPHGVSLLKMSGLIKGFSILYRPAPALVNRSGCASGFDRGGGKGIYSPRRQESPPPRRTV